MRRIVLILSLFILTLSATSQERETERLRQEIKNHPQQDTFRVNRLNELASTGSLSADEIEKLANEALAIARKTGYTNGEGYALLNLGAAYTNKGNRPEADVFLKQADSIAGKTGDQELLVHILLKRGNTRLVSGKESLAYSLRAEEIAQKTGNKKLLSLCQRFIEGTYQASLSDYSKAMEYGMKSINSGEEADCLECLANAWSNVASLYSVLGDQAKSLAYYQKALDANKQLGNKILTANLLTNIGERYRLTGKYQEAIQSYKESLQDLTDPYRIEIAESNIADVYVRSDSLALAFEYGFRSLDSATKIEDNEGVAWIEGILSRAYLKKKMPDSALYYARHGLDVAKQTGTIEFMQDNAEALANAYAFKNDFKNAYSYHNLYINYRDSMINAEIANKSTVLEYNNDLEKKQGQIAVLNQQKKLQQNFLISVSVVLLLIIITAIALLRNNRQKRLALAELKQTQAQLIQSEKMASLGELTAGIAHEIQNPLNFINNFSDVNTELIAEMNIELKAGNTENAVALANDIAGNEQKINHHGKRADTIVKGMLQHSQTHAGQKEPTNINTLADEYLRLSYHGLRAKDKSFNATLQTNFEAGMGKINIIQQEIGRVLLNLYNNAFYAVSEKKNVSTGSALNDQQYEPTITVTTKRFNFPSGTRGIEIRVKDNGNGIPQKIIDKIFQPFYTTKPAGQGTGLGLSLSYDIIKAHAGEIKVETKEGEGTEFIIQLPAA